jgi:hypothetical protein
VKLQTYNKLHIDVMVINLVTDEELWHFTGFYGEARRELRYRSWDCLRLLNSRSNIVAFFLKEQEGQGPY